MKIEWEESDIKVGKMVVQKASNEKLLIGYMPSCQTKNKYVTISLSDGMVCNPVSKEDLAKHLTTYGWVPSEIGQVVYPK